MLPLYDLLFPLTLLILAAAGFSYTGWRLLGRHGAWSLAGYAACAALLFACLGVGRILLATPPASPPRPGVLPATFVILAIMFGAAFAGATLALIRLFRRSGPTSLHPVRVGVLGFFIGAAVPLVYAFVQDVRRLL